MNKHNLYKAAVRLGNTYRFAQLKLDKPYNGAEHSFRVAILAMTIVHDYNNKNPNKQVNTEEVLLKALLHDLEESLIGDISTPVKNRSQDFKQAYLTLAKELVREDVFKGSPNPELYQKLWEEDKKDETGEIIKLADGLEALSTAHYEILRGNLSLKNAFINLKNSMSKPEIMGLMEKYHYAKQFFLDHSTFPEALQSLLDATNNEQDF